jgi:hypothetical protein
VDDAVFASALDHFLKRHLRTRLINRLIAYVLVNLAVYMLLLAVVILSDSSLFVFHLLLFCSLSLLPLFLLLGAERTTPGRIVRSIDEHCLVESYLHTPSIEHRSFMRRRVESYLERRKTERAFPFRLFRGNLYLIGACLLLFVLLQVTSFIMLQDFTVALSAQSIKKRLTERSAMEEAVAELPVDDAADAASSAAEELRPTPGGETGEQRIGKTAEEAALEELLADEPMVAKDRIARLGPEDLREESEPAAQQGDTEWRYRVPGSESDKASEKTSGIPGDEGQDTSREGSGAEAGTSDVGRTFRESPIREYTTVLEPLSAEGSEELSPSTNVAESRRQTFLSAVFSDFDRISYLSITFDPLFDTIREQYLELLDERF